MPLELAHALKPDLPADACARQDFVSTLRGYILNDMASSMQAHYERQVEPRFVGEHGRRPADQDEVHRVMSGDLVFKFYSAVRYNAQEMVWRSVIPVVEAGLPALTTAIQSLSGQAGGALTLDPALPIPENVTAVDVHLMPGGYAPSATPAAGAIYDQGLAVFSAGLMGKNLDDIGQSMANFVRIRFPDFHPRKILDCGATVGHNALAWAQTFPDAEVHAIDVSAAVMIYAHGRAESLGWPVHFHQMDATDLRFEDASFDVVFTSMFLHELSVKDIKAFLSEARRVLRPGGLLINMELPPNDELKPYDQFYLDWDCYYNNEPFYRTYRDQKPEHLVEQAGFPKGAYFQFVAPQYSYVPREAFEAAVAAPEGVSGGTGRLAEGVQWFGFGAWAPE
jgi:ubiquinone/menaquinone biosynthesis C-methylase UbiE